MKLVPKRRFKGFSGEWEEEELGNITKINTGDSDVKDAVIDGRYPFFVRSDIVQKSKKYTFDGEAILIPGEGRLGEVFHYIDGKFDYHQRVYKISNFAENISGKFVYFAMRKSFKEHAMKNTVKSTVNSLRLPMLTEYTINVPFLEEQEKINPFFTCLDNKIVIQKARLEKLQALKQAYLNEMFPAEGESVPKRRFAGFTGEWAKRQLGEVSNIIAGGDIDNTQILNEGTYPVVANALANEGIVGYYNKYYRIEAPAVTVTGRGEIGNAVARKVNFTPVVRLLVVKSDHDVDFLANAINKLHIFSESTGVPQLTVPQLGNYQIYFPSVEEQQKIGSFFRKLDERIAMQEAKVEKLKAMKSAYLNEMFV